MSNQHKNYLPRVGSVSEQRRPTFVETEISDGGGYSGASFYSSRYIIIHNVLWETFKTAILELD